MEPVELSRRAEDYLRVIYELVEEKGRARIKEIAARVNVKPPSAVDMVRRLSKMGLVRHERYEGITLTPKGLVLARAVKHRHETLLKFLEILEVPREVAERDAHELEHRLSPETLLKIEEFVRRHRGSD